MLKKIISNIKLVYYKKVAWDILFNQRKDFDKNNSIIKNELIILIQAYKNTLQDKEVYHLLKYVHGNIIDLSKEVSFVGIFNFNRNRFVDISNKKPELLEIKDDIISKVLRDYLIGEDRKMIADYALKLFYINTYLSEQNYSLRLKKELILIADELINRYNKNFENHFFNKKDRREELNLLWSIDIINKYR